MESLEIGSITGARSLSSSAVTRSHRWVHERYEDPCYVAMRLRKLADVEFLLLRDGGFRAELSLATFGSIIAYSFSFGSPVLIRGRRLPDLSMLAPITQIGSKGWFRGRTLAYGEVVFGDPNSPINRLVQAGEETHGLIFPQAVLLAALGLDPGEEVPPQFADYQVLRPRRDRFEALRWRYDRLIASVKGGQPLAWSQQDVIDQLLSPWLGRTQKQLAAAPLKKRQRIVQGAEAIMSGALEEPLRIEAICEQLQVSRRTLFYAFQSRLGMTPLDFFKALRLSEGHRLLFCTRRSIRDIAHSVGYHHQGRFAMDYRRRFGVKPSDAMRPESPLTLAVEPLPLEGFIT